MKQNTLSFPLRPIDAVSSLPAHNVIVCAPTLSFESEMYQYLTDCVNNPAITFEYRIILDLLQSSGCRVSAIINSSGLIVRLNGLIVAHETKTKQDIVFRSINFNDYFMQYAGQRFLLLTGYNRFMVYRLFKKYGISAQILDNSKSSVTHLPRHLVGSLTMQSTSDINDVSLVLSHKSIKSSHTYGKAIKK